MDMMFTTVSNAIISGEVNTGVKEVKKLLSRDITAPTLLHECIEPTLDMMGEQFSKMEVFLPELLNAAEVVGGILKTLAHYLYADEERDYRGTVIIATVYGDSHSIGKNLVSLMLQLEGFKVHDLGVDVHMQSIVDQAVSLKADIVCLSALMLTTKLFVKDTVEMLRKHPELSNTKIMVGGGAVNEKWAMEIGTDGYAPDAASAAKAARKLMDGVRSKQKERRGIDYPHLTLQI
jgi:5-methyltetrahydrofolate--homocysteine methyltransferase